MTIEDELSGLLEAERAVRPSQTALAHGWQRLAVDLASHAPAMTVAVGPLKMAVGTVPKWLAGGFAIGLLGAGTASLVVPSAPAPLARVVIAPSAVPRAVPSPKSVAPEVALPAVAESVALPSARTPIPVLSASARTEPARATFDAELELISLAKSELDAQQNAQARQTLARHAELFPSGVFATERDALAMVAQCQQGPKNPTLGARFASQHPGSPLVQRVDRACAVRAPSADFPNLPNGSDGPRGTNQ